MSTETATPPPTAETLDRLPSDTRAVQQGYAKIKQSRNYAADDATWRQLISLFRASHPMVGDTYSDENFIELLERVAPHVPGMTQSWQPPRDEPAVPAVPRDNITGMPALNPYAEDSSSASSVASRQVLEAKYPALARHLKRLSTDRGYTFKYHAELEEAKARSASLRALKYGAQQHAQNPFLGDNLSAQSEFILTHDPLVVEIYRLEARPVRLPWGVDSTNLSEQGRIFDDLRSNPTRAGISANVVLDAAAIDKNLVAAMRAQAEAEARAAKARAAALGRKIA